MRHEIDPICDYCRWCGKARCDIVDEDRGCQGTRDIVSFAYAQARGDFERWTKQFDRCHPEERERQ